MCPIIRRDDLPGTPGGVRFVGSDHGGMPVSFFLVHGLSGRWTRAPSSSVR